MECKQDVVLMCELHCNMPGPKCSTIKDLITEEHPYQPLHSTNFVIFSSLGTTPPVGSNHLMTFGERKEKATLDTA